MLTKSPDKLVPGADPDPASPDHATQKTTTDARSGVETSHMRWVLRISMAAVVIGFAVAWWVSIQP